MATREHETGFNVMIEPPAFPACDAMTFAARRRRAERSQMVVVSMAGLARDAL